MSYSSSFPRRLFLRIMRRVGQWIQEAERLASYNALSQMGAHGTGCAINGRSRISFPQGIQLGNNVHIGDNSYIRAEGGLIIGDNTHISRNLVLYTINHRWEGSRLPYDDKYVTKAVVIGRNVWIGMNVCIAPGTIIGDGAIIGMGCVVSGEIPPLAIVGNQKWRVIGSRDAGLYKQLDEAGAYGGASGRALD